VIPNAESLPAAAVYVDVLEMAIGRVLQRVSASLLSGDRFREPVAMGRVYNIERALKLGMSRLARRLSRLLCSLQ
jgi:hypothetical protein